MCERWRKNTFKNPFTGRNMSQHGPQYKTLRATCTSDSICETWFENGDINPITGRKIKRNGPMYNRLTIICLYKFVAAQQDTYNVALAEIRAGKKTGHWIWYIFPQLIGLGTSETSKRYAIKSLDEAKAYLSHPILGPRYIECVSAILNHGQTRSVRRIFGSDAVKVQSSLTLFYHADPRQRVFQTALNVLFDGKTDEMTNFLLNV